MDGDVNAQMFSRRMYGQEAMANGTKWNRTKQRERCLTPVHHRPRHSLHGPRPLGMTARAASQSLGWLGRKWCGPWLVASDSAVCSRTRVGAGCAVRFSFPRSPSLAIQPRPRTHLAHTRVRYVYARAH